MAGVGRVLVTGMSGLIGSALRKRLDGRLPVLLLAQVHLERGDCQEVVTLLERLPAEARTGEVAATLAEAKRRLPHARRLLGTTSVEDVSVLCLVPGGRHALASWGSQLLLLDLATGSIVRTLEGSAGTVESIEPCRINVGGSSFVT